MHLRSNIPACMPYLEHLKQHFESDLRYAQSESLQTPHPPCKPTLQWFVWGDQVDLNERWQCWAAIP
jgi:hypothetical protein